MRREGRLDLLLEARRLLLLEPLEHVSRSAEDGLGRIALVAVWVHAVLDRAQQEPDALHHELVEVAGEDAQEADALEQRAAIVGRLSEHALVELEPRQIAVEERRVVGDIGARS